FVLHASAAGNQDRENPAVSRMAADTGSWVTCWQQRDNTVANDDWDIIASRVTQLGFLVGSDPELSINKVAAHSIVPKVAGQNGRYLVTWSDTSAVSGTGGNHVYARRFDWSDAISAPSLLSIRTISSLPANSGQLVNSGVAFDTRTTSHW